MKWAFSDESRRSGRLVIAAAVVETGDVVARGGPGVAGYGTPPVTRPSGWCWPARRPSQPLWPDPVRLVHPL
jgi:hypothetical protein